MGCWFSGLRKRRRSRLAWLNSISRVRVVTPRSRDWAEWRSLRVIMRRVVSVVPTAQGIVNGAFSATGTGGLLSEVPSGPVRSKHTGLGKSSGDRVAGLRPADSREGLFPHEDPERLDLQNYGHNQRTFLGL